MCEFSDRVKLSMLSKFWRSLADSNSAASSSCLLSFVTVVVGSLFYIDPLINIFCSISIYPISSLHPNDGGLATLIVMVALVAEVLSLFDGL